MRIWRRCRRDAGRTGRVGWRSMLDREGRIWLTDFGLGRRANDVTLSLAGALLGTPRYMSPEQAEEPGIRAPRG